MRVNPFTVYHFDSSAEKKLFSAFQKSELEEGTVFHSLNIPKHEKKQYAEADFVVVSVYGVMVLEVKGGGISSQDGVWYSENRHGNVTKLRESPVDQAKSAKEALVDLFLEKELTVDVTRINFGYGVMFPDVKSGDLGIELTKEMVFDVIDWDRKQLRRWLEKLYRYWAERKKIQKTLSNGEVSELKKALRPEFDKGWSLLAEVDTVWENLISLTERQYDAVDTILDNNRVIIRGGAGTGKTLVAVRAAEALNQQNTKVLFLCRSPVLASFLKNRLKHTQITVLDFMAFREKWELGRLPVFDALIVDEGQDMLDMESIDLLDNAIQGGFAEGRWCFFTDPNNQGSLYARFDPDALEYLRSCSAKVSLSRNCRNTREIAIHTLAYTGGDIGKKSPSAGGVPVKTKGLDYGSSEQLAQFIAEQLSEWIDDEGVQPGDITILSPVEFEQSSANLMEKRWRRKITVINESFGERWAETQLTFSTIRDFKGLENKYVMLIDTEKMIGSPTDINQLYVGMTRANVLLWMPMPVSGKEWFEANFMENQSLVTDFLENS